MLINQEVAPPKTPSPSLAMCFGGHQISTKTLKKKSSFSKLDRSSLEKGKESFRERRGLQAGTHCRPFNKGSSCSLCCLLYRVGVGGKGGKQEALGPAVLPGYTGEIRSSVGFWNR